MKRINVKRIILCLVTVFILLMLCSCEQQSEMMENVTEKNDAKDIPFAQVSEDNVEPSFSQDYDTLPLIYCFQQRDIAVEPKIQDYTFEDAVQTGEVWEIDGILPGAGMGTWYIVDIEGVEYYYGKYDLTEPENYILFGWSLIDETHELTNGIRVGMNEKDIMDQFPNMAVIDFEGNFVYDEVVGFMDWNGVAYPRSAVGMDSDWIYDKKDYHWTDQFDYIMVADITLNNPDGLPIYLGLLMKDNVVDAITFYNPTAG